jgi:hypothetical protein
MRNKGNFVTVKNMLSCSGLLTTVLIILLGWSAPGFTQSFTVPSAFIQTRTFEDPSLNYVEARILLRKDGALIDGSEITSVVLRDSSGWELRPTSEPQFHKAVFIAASWDPFSDWAWHVSGYSAFRLRYPALEAGTFSFEVETTEGDVITRVADFPGMVELAPVPGHSMFSEWLPDGSLLLGWWEPWWDPIFDQYRLTFTGPEGNEIFVGRTERGVSQLILPPALIKEIRKLGETDEIGWRVMTSKRYETAGGTDYARGISNVVFLSLQPLPSVGPVYGQVMTTDGSPLPFGATVTLQRWMNWDFVDINQFYPWSGEFFFDTDWYGNILTPGDYRIVASAPGHSTAVLEPRFLEDGDSWDLGTIVLQALSQGGNIGGRLVDKWTGAPLPGHSPPYAWITLLRLTEGGWSEWVGSQPSSATGEFLFTPDNTAGLFAGKYLVEVLAQGYEAYQSDLFDVAAEQHVDLGDLTIAPIPILIANVLPCDPIFPGGICSFSLEVINRSNVPFQGGSWSTVQGWGLGSPLGSTVFQTAAKGTKKPLEKVQMKPGEAKVLTFEFSVPAAFPEWATFCIDAYVGDDPDPLFNTVAHDWLFCVSKTPGGLELLPEKKVREMKLKKK